MASYTRRKCRFCEKLVSTAGAPRAAHLKKHLKELGLSQIYYNNNQAEARLVQAQEKEYAEVLQITVVNGIASL